MKYTLRYTGEFKRSLKRCLKRGYDEQSLIEVLNILAAEGRLPEKYHPHRGGLRVNERSKGIRI